MDGIETRTIYESVPGLFGERVPELDREHVSVNSSAFIDCTSGSQKLQ